MTMQLKLLMSGVFLLLLVTILAMVAMEREFDLPAALKSGATVTDQAGIAPAATARPQAERAGQATPRGTVASDVQSGTAVSQAQLDLMAKREEARLRRDEMLNMRAETIRKMGPGNTGDQLTGQ
jgi:hypothetical protein